MNVIVNNYSSFFNHCKKTRSLVKMSTKKNFVTVEGVVTIAYPNGMFSVHLDNDIDVLTVVSGKIRYRTIRVVPGDRVTVELPLYDLSKGRIIYRHPVKRNDDDDFISATDQY
uniref:Translation initiation factor IF-1, chloroplastic n=2 Tax=Glyptostrobus pensilis TaxID=28978 RepID=A0A8F8XA28_9CONI|nr:translation initiation factor 1 [Glyptostrobus pensilis]